MRYLSGALRGWVALDNVAAALAPNHLEFTCGLPLISAAVNGASVASVSDAMYTGGHAWLGASNLPDHNVSTPALFTNLLMTQD